jgi:hypothetical protein
MANPSFTSVPHQFQQPSMLTATSSGSRHQAVSSTDDAALLRSYAVMIADLNRAQNLRDAISQVESGGVQDLRDRYGPKDGRFGADPLWKNLKGKVTKRERLHTLLIDQFRGDHDRFFDFFTITSPVVPSKGGKRKVSDTLEGEHMVALRLVVEAIPHCCRDMEEVRARTEYIDPGNGQFSEEHWRAAWGDQNDWEVWRLLGMEHYGQQDVNDTSG